LHNPAEKADQSVKLPAPSVLQKKKKENEKMSATGNAHLNLCQSQATTRTVFRGLGRQTNKCTSEHNGKVYFAKAWLVN